MQVSFNRTDSLETRPCGPVETRLTEEPYPFNDGGVLEEDVTTRELNILLLLAIEAYSKDSNAELSFQGIKTKLNLHQQKVTIALKRLQEKNLISRTLNGYTLTKTGIEVINSLLKSPINLDPESQEYIGYEITVPLYNKNNDLFRLVYLLKGRWFANWRWVGMFQNHSSIKMEWQSISGELEACLCLNEERMCIAVFDKNSTPLKMNPEFLDEEFNKFIFKIEKILETDTLSCQAVSKTMIKADPNCDKMKISNWLSNYA